MREPEEKDEHCPNSKRVDGDGHSFLFDGDDPYVVCAYCGQRRGTTHGMIYD